MKMTRTLLKKMDKVETLLQLEVDQVLQLEVDQLLLKVVHLRLLIHMKHLIQKILL